MTQPRYYGLVGVGFGPAGIAIGVALNDDHELGAAPAGSLGLGDALFLEQAPDSTWQPGMVLPGTDIQHHFLRDFATPRFPSSRFTFVQYLHAKSRLYSFTLRSGYVTRAEWSDYCLWLAGELGANVEYSTRALRLEPVRDDGRLVAVDVVAQHLPTGEVTRRRTTRVVLNTGHRPYVPPLFEALLGPQVFHSSEFSTRWAALPRAPRRVAVVGGGQNAGEVLLHLHHSTDAELVSVVRNSGFRLYDLGHFVNQAYWPAETDYFHALPKAGRMKVFDEQYRTNYAAVDPDVSTGLYNAWYDGQVSGRQRLDLRKRVEVVGAHPVGDQVRLCLRDPNTGVESTVDADVVVLGTGFREELAPALLDPLAGDLTFDDDGDLEVARDFSAGLAAPSPVRIYLNGVTERRHGIASATSFSLLALRAGEITASARREAVIPAEPSTV